MTIRCKMKCSHVTTVDYGHPYGSKEYTFRAEYDSTIPEDVRFAKASPSGEFKIFIDNPSAQAAFVPGKFYYFDAIAVDEAK